MQLAPAEGMETDPDSATFHRLLMAVLANQMTDFVNLSEFSIVLRFVVLTATKTNQAGTSCHFAAAFGSDEGASITSDF